MPKKVLATLAALALLVAGCGGDDDESGAGVEAGDETTTTTTDAAASQEAATIQLRDTSLGRVITDAEGMTLYLFTKDTDGQSACSGGCAEVWPPVVVTSEPTVGDGLDAAKVATITRSDGAMQVTYGGAPLYRYTPDEAPGDTKGQNVGGVWFVVGADGKAIT